MALMKPSSGLNLNIWKLQDLRPNDSIWINMGYGSSQWVPQQFHGFTLYKAAKNRELRRFYVLATSHVRAGYLPLLAGAGRMTLANLVHLVNWIVILRKRLSCLIMSLADV